MGPYANLTGLTDTRSAVLQTRTRSMTYDARDRLLTTTYGYNGRVVTYGYDVLDNLRTTSETLSGRNHRHEYGTDGRLTRIVDPSAPTVSVIGYSYNDRGNATSRTSATGFVPNTSSIVSDEANRIRSMTTAGALETFTYDGHGRRTRATTSSGTLMHFYTQAGQLLFSENPATPTTLIKSRQYHIYLGSRRIAQKEMDALYYIHNDHLGSLLARTDPAGSLVEGAPVWEPWGAPTGIGSSGRGLRYAGHYTDFATGLSYMQQRYYDPYAGRFLAVDPVAASPGSFNRYWYANNNPYKYVDPDGHWTCSSSKGECDALEESINEAKKSLGSGRLNEEESKKLNDALSALGEKGDDRVRIKFSAHPDKEWAGQAKSGGTGKTMYSDITINTSRFPSPLRSGPSLGGTVVHESGHASEDFARGRGVATLEERRATEVSAYTAEAIYYKSINYVTGLRGLWTPIGGLNQDAIRTSVERSINASCAQAPSAASCN